MFACVNSLSRAVSAAIIRNLQLPPDEPWLCLGACVFYNAVCWVIVLAAYYPATHAVRAMVEDDNFAQTWYVFWVLPLAFILLNLFMIPRYQSTLQTGRVLQGYIVLSSALLFFMFCFNAVFLLMATSLNRNAKLQQENQFLSMQQQRYENLRTAIEEARQARHDMRHQLNQISALAEAGDLENLKATLQRPSPASRILICASVKTVRLTVLSAITAPWQSAMRSPSAPDSTCRKHCRLTRSICVWCFPTCWKMRWRQAFAPHRAGGRSKLTAYLHADRILLIEVENAFDGEVNEKNGVSALPSGGKTVSVSSLSRILQRKPAAQVRLPIRMALFSAKVMLCGESSRQRPQTAPRSCTESVESNAESAETCHIKKQKLLSPNGNLYAKRVNFISKNGNLHAKSGK